MKIQLLLFILLINCFSGQNKKDSLYSFFEKNSDITARKLYKADPSKYRSYRFDSSWIQAFNKYKELVSEDDIKNLKNSDNSSLHLIGILIDLNNNNSKEKFFEEINELLNNNKFEFIESVDNEKNIGVHIIEGEVLNFIRKENDFYKPSFQLTRREYVNLNIEIGRLKGNPFYKLRREYHKSNH